MVDTSKNSVAEVNKALVIPSRYEFSGYAFSKISVPIIKIMTDEIIIFILKLFRTDCPFTFSELTMPDVISIGSNNIDCPRIKTCVSRIIRIVAIDKPCFNPFEKSV